MSEQDVGATVEAVTRLRVLLEQHACLRGDFILSSGLKSKYYFDSKPVTLSPDGRALIGRILEPIVRDAGADAVGGLVIGAVPISDAIELPSFIVRDEKKGHGTKERIAASYSIRGSHSDLRPGLRVVIVDDVVTTGRSIKRAINAVKASGCQVVAVVVLVTRPEANAAEDLGKNYRYISLFECDTEGKLSLTTEAEKLISSPVA